MNSLAYFLIITSLSVSLFLAEGIVPGNHFPDTKGKLFEAINPELRMPRENFDAVTIECQDGILQASFNIIQKLGLKVLLNNRVWLSSREKRFIEYLLEMAQRKQHSQNGMFIPAFYDNCKKIVEYLDHYSPEDLMICLQIAHEENMDKAVCCAIGCQLYTVFQEKKPLVALYNKHLSLNNVIFGQDLVSQILERKKIALGTYTFYEKSSFNNGFLQKSNIRSFTF